MWDLLLIRDNLLLLFGHLRHGLTNYSSRIWARMMSIKTRRREIFFRVFSPIRGQGKNRQTRVQLRKLSNRQVPNSKYLPTLNDMI